MSVPDAARPRLNGPVSTPATLDFSAFSAPVSKAEVDAWRAAAKAARAPWAVANIGVIIALVVLVPILLSIIVIPVAMVGALFASTDSGGGVGVVAAMLIFLSAAVITIPLLISRFSRSGRWERWLRIDRFARANGLVFSPADANPRYAGSIFQLGSGRQATEHLMSQSGRFFDMGNYQYTTSSGKNSTTHTWGFMALKLDRRLPHMVLDAQANNGFFGSNLPASFDKSQILSLEGDFPRYFTLYCPRRYERDALYVFTPDLMALLIDNAAPFDVEVIDDWMFVYASQPFTMTWPGVYGRLFRILQTVGAKTVTQTDSYADDRTALPFAANVVAPPGTRLRQRVPIVAIVIVALVVLLPILISIGIAASEALSTIR